MSEVDKEFLKFLMLAVPMLLVAVVFVSLLSWKFSVWQCEVFSKETHRETKYINFVGCLVNTPTGWVDADKLRGE